MDAMLDGKGYFKGSSALLTGGPGTGKTTLAAHFADGCCRRGERCLWFSFEESPSQLVRNMRSVGIDLQPWIDNNLLRCQASRPSLGGLEMHLALMLKAVRDFRPSAVVVDPFTALMASGAHHQTASMALRVADYLKTIAVTTLYLGVEGAEGTAGLAISSIMDTWILLRNQRSESDLSRRLHIVKARGMAHSSQVRVMAITNAGVRLSDLTPRGHAGEKLG
jgi:circadian clock protein KaiC